MAQQEGGWPLGLQPLNGRVGLYDRNIIHDRNGSISFGTLLTGSPTSSTASSSDFDTESTGSFFRDKSITLGSLIGISGILDLSRRSIRGRPTIETSREKKSCKTRPWIFSLCSKLSTDVINTNDNNAPSLSHYLEAERRTASIYKRDQSPHTIGLDGISQMLRNSNSNSIIVGQRRDLCGHNNGHGSPLSLSRLCGYIAQ